MNQNRSLNKILDQNRLFKDLRSRKSNKPRGIKINIGSQKAKKSDKRIIKFIEKNMKKTCENHM